MQNYLSENDLRVLFSAKVLLSHYKNTPVYPYYSRPTVETTVNQDIWKAIQDALNKNHILQFDYTDRWGKQTEQRKLRPYQLVLDDGVCYLFGFDELRNAERIFSLVRMRNAVVTDEAFELP